MILKRAAWLSLSILAACTTPPTVPPSSTASRSPAPSAITAVTATPGPSPLGTQSNCHVTLAIDGPSTADVDGFVVGAARRNGKTGNGIDIDVLFDAQVDGRQIQMLLSIWDADSSAGPEPTQILYGPFQGVGLQIDSGVDPDMGSASIADDGGHATFDVVLKLGSKLQGAIECPPLLDP